VYLPTFHGSCSEIANIRQQQRKPIKAPAAIWANNPQHVCVSEMPVGVFLKYDNTITTGRNKINQFPSIFRVESIRLLRHFVLHGQCIDYLNWTGNIFPFKPIDLLVGSTGGLFNTISKQIKFQFNHIENYIWNIL